MSNQFSKEEVVAFEAVLEGFEDQLVLSQNISKYEADQTTMERANDTIWRPMPYIAQSHDGTDATSNFDEATQLSVPARIGYTKHSTAILTALELRDALQEGRLGKAAAQKLASDVNLSVMNVAALQGTLFVKRTAAASGFDDLAECEAVMNEQGIGGSDRKIALSTRDYNGMASNLAGRATMTGKPTTAYEKAFVGHLANFDTFKLDYATRQAAAGGGAGLTINTLVAGANYYTPVATSTSATGEQGNVDNRYQTITVSSTTSVLPGDSFTVATLDAVHHISKGDTGRLKTFRVISVPSATTLVISPPMITGQGGTDAEIVYQNCVINTPAANSAIVFLNTVAAAVNPFWHKDAIELMPGRYAVPSDSGAGVMRSTIANGLEVVMTKFFDINTMKTKFRWDVRWGVNMMQPEMAGVMEFSQT
ncbi:MAG: P22 phage major capsid protein family protein [Pseudomonadota bacterium]